MDDEQIIQLAKKHLEVLISDDEDEEHPTDFAATYNQIIKFARCLLDYGFSEGHKDGYDEGVYDERMYPY